MPRTLLKVFGGWVVVVYRVSLVFTFSTKLQLKFGPSSTKLTPVCKFWTQKILLDRNLALKFITRREFGPKNFLTERNLAIKYYHQTYYQSWTLLTTVLFWSIKCQNPDSTIHSTQPNKTYWVGHHTSPEGGTSWTKESQHGL